MAHDALICACCGKPLDGMPKDMAFRLPDEVAALPPSERQMRVKATSDLCSLDDRFFIRAVLALPLRGTEDAFRWGVWVEVEEAVFARYLELYSADGTGEPEQPGTIANQPPGYEPAIGQQVLVKFGDASARPQVSFPRNAMHTLARQQAAGLQPPDYHALLRNIGMQSH